VCGFVGGLLGGVMSDRFGRRAMLIWPRVFFLLVTWPVFDMIVRHHDAASLLGGTAVLTFSSALSTASVFVAITESLRKEVRVTGLGAMYAIAVAVFGGTTQLVVRWLIEATGDPRSIASYTIAATLVGLVASVAMRETAVRLQPLSAAAPAPGS
jgi:MFS family permease